MNKKMKFAFESKGLIEQGIIVPNVKVIGRFNEEINVGYKYLNGCENYIQNLTFDTSDKEYIKKAKLWLQDYTEIKKNNSTQKNKINVVYCPPSSLTSDFSNVLSCLEEASDELIDYKDTEKYNYYINKVINTAHN